MVFHQGDFILAKILCFSGAGLSAESGVPTFRDANGLWEGFRPEDVADFRTWRKNWDLVFKFYNDRRVALAGVQPNAAHRMIASWQKDFECHVLTQNVDDRFGSTRIDTRKGERWFCTEREARDNGWKHAWE
jgi:NAD-dependent deacetylase